MRILSFLVIYSLVALMLGRISFSHTGEIKSYMGEHRMLFCIPGTDEHKTYVMTQYVKCS